MTKTLVTFRSSAFNTIESKPQFINADCFGDDVAEWLGGELRKRGIAAGEPGTEDFGAYLPFDHAGKHYDFVITYRPDEPEGEWICRVQNNSSILRSLFGGSEVPNELTKVIHEVLASNPDIRSIRWHDENDFDKGQEDRASPNP